jgi:GntR family transcriptional regulator
MLDKNSPKPLYAQLEEILRSSILRQEWAPNHAIPSELELSRTYGVSRMTARAVVTQLVHDGLLRRVQGKGTFVVEQKIPTKSLAYMGIREQLERMGYRITTKLMGFSQVEASQGMADVLDIRQGEPVHFIERLRFIDDKPISLHRSYIPRALTPTLRDEKLESEQLCVILQNEFNLKSATVSETLESVTASPDEAALLNVGKSFPLLMLEDINKTSTGRIFEYTKVLFRGDKVKLNFEYVTGASE